MDRCDEAANNGDQIVSAWKTGRTQTKMSKLLYFSKVTSLLVNFIVPGILLDLALAKRKHIVIVLIIVLSCTVTVHVFDVMIMKSKFKKNKK